MISCVRTIFPIKKIELILMIIVFTDFSDHNLSNVNCSTRTMKAVKNSSNFNGEIRY